MKTVILDTDFLLQSLRWKIALEDELSRILNTSFTLAILDQTLEELKGKPDESLARAYTQRLTILPTTQDKSVDELLLEYPNPDSILVATQDKALKEKLKKRKIPIITIRNKSHLELI